ncbi:MAG: SPOR domain-containing protein [Zoogloeaceae bacterium]|nr:SPOR domain-containing protein [Zoogloeaceae bacterium]
MLRAVVILLVVLNLLAFAGLQGWLGVASRQGEPERLTNQLHPERIVLHGPLRERKAAKDSSPASPIPAPTSNQAVAPGREAASTSPPACAALTAPTPEAAKSLLSALARQEGVTVQDLPLEPPSSWWVHLPPAESRAAAEALVADLRQKGVTDVYIMNESTAYPYAVSLGLFKQVGQADRLLDQLRSRGVAAAVVTARSASPGRRIEVRGSQAAVDGALAQGATRAPGLEAASCAP